MTPEIQQILARHYGYAKGAASKLGPLSRAERSLVAEAGYPVDKKVSLEHDDVIKRLEACVGKLEPEAVLDAFVAGVGGSNPRGRQSVISYAYARHLPRHASTATAQLVCDVCGLPRREKIDPTKEVLGFYMGSVWNEMPIRYVVDLEELARGPLPRSTADDRHSLQRLLEVAASATPKITPSELEKTIAKQRVIDEKDKYGRYGILEALGELGVLPNPLVPPTWDQFVTTMQRREANAKLKVSHRSDIVLPFGAWRGELGVDWERARALFGLEPPKKGEKS
jgi:hypothetical protein